MHFRILLSSLQKKINFPKSTWFCVTGGIYTGKSVVAGDIIEFIVNERPDINIWGFYQPSIIEDGERVGYDIEILKDRELNIYPFARQVLDPMTGRKYYKFENTSYIEIEKAIQKFVIDDRPIIFVFDEFGWMELKKEGHFPYISKALSKIPSQRQVAVVFITNAGALGEIPPIIADINGKMSHTVLRCPASDDELHKFVHAVIKSSKNNSD